MGSIEVAEHIELPRRKKVENHDVQVMLKTEASLERVNAVLSEFVPMYEKNGETILYPVTVEDGKGTTELCFSGKRGRNGFMEEGRLHIIREEDGNRQKLDIVVNAIPTQSLHDLNLAYSAIKAAARVYGRSDLSRRTS